MKIKNLKTAKIERPFYKDDKISIVGKEENSKIVGFDVRNKSQTKFIPVVKDNVLKAWQTVERFFENI